MPWAMPRRKGNYEKLTEEQKALLRRRGDFLVHGRKRVDEKRREEIRKKCEAHTRAKEASMSRIQPMKHSADAAILLVYQKNRRRITKMTELFRACEGAIKGTRRYIIELRARRLAAAGLFPTIKPMGGRRAK